MPPIHLPDPPPDDDLPYLALAALYHYVGRQLEPFLAPDADLPRMFAQSAARASDADNARNIHDGTGQPDKAQLLHDGNGQPDRERLLNDGTGQPDKAQLLHDGNGQPDRERLLNDGTGQPDKAQLLNDGNGQPDRERLLNDGNGQPDKERLLNDGNDQPDKEQLLNDGNPADPLFHPATLNYLRGIAFALTATRLLNLIHAEAHRRLWFGYTEHLSPSSVSRWVTRFGLPRDRTMTARTFTVSLPALGRLLTAYPRALPPTASQSDRLAHLLHALTRPPDYSA